jgi:hypothetical protein
MSTTTGEQAGQQLPGHTSNGRTANRKQRSPRKAASKTPAPARAAPTPRTPIAATEAARKVGGAPPMLMNALFERLPPSGTEMTDQQAVTFVEAVWANLRLCYNLKGTITIKAAA